MGTESTDIRLKYISYSSLLTAHACPRKYQLQKLQAQSSGESADESVTFAFGHVVGDGIQLALQGKTEAEIILHSFLRWNPELYAENSKQVKSFWYAISAIQKFIALRTQGLLKDYELLYFEGAPAVELSFKVALPDGYFYRGHVDAVLRHIHTGKIIVLEVKTTSSNTVNPATYKNSSQAIGYSIVLDHVVKELSSYEVFYLVYKSKSMEFESPFRFTKSHLQRALWLNEILLDVKTLKMYEEAGVYPMRGESCYNFFRECEYFSTCTLSTKHLTTELTEKKRAELEDKIYTVNVTIDELIQAQLTKELI